MRRSLVLMTGCVVLLTGCGQAGSNARELLGMDHKAPDAFSISTHAPLEVPVNLDANLPVPQPGAARPQEITPQSRARTVLTGEALPAVSGRPEVTVSALDGAASPSAPSAAEQALLQQSGAAAVDPNIRARVNAEAAEDVKAQHGPLDWLVFWRDKPRPGVAVDAEAEAARIKANQAGGRAATEGATPVIEDSGRLSVPEEIK